MSDQLWHTDDPAAWAAALAHYLTAIATRAVSRLPELDQWYREEFPPLLTARQPLAITHDELVRITEWKMKRGAWRARNLVLVRGNDPDLVAQLSTAAFALAPDPRKPIARLAELAGVGPATASAVLAAAYPEHYPFFDELVAAQIPDLGPVAFTLPYYLRYATHLRDRATRLPTPWTAHLVSQALWAVSET